MPRRSLAIGLALAVAGLVPPAAVAQPAVATRLPGTRPPALHQRVADLEALTGMLVGALAVVERRLAAETAAREAAEAALAARAEALERLTRYFAVELDDIDGLPGPHLVITGANVHLRSGSGLSDDGGEPAGLGNLVLGYNEAPDDLEPGDRLGSHNLVVGPGRRFSGVGAVATGDEQLMETLGDAEALR